MAFGLLGSIIPQINRNEIFYTSPEDTLAIGKVSISSKNYNPVKIRLGITEDDVNIEYLEYNRFINYGETFETEQIHLGNGQKLVARSTDPNVNFLFYGETIDESANPENSGMLGSVLSNNSFKKLLYTAPVESTTIVTLSVCNLDSQPAKARIGISNAGLNDFDSSEYLEYDVEIGPNQTYTRTEIKLDQNQSLICSSSQDSNISFVCHGRLFYGGSPTENLNVNGNATINGNLGVGIVSAREKFDLVGNALISGSLSVNSFASVNGNLNLGSNLNVSGEINGNISSGSLNQSLINLGSLPEIDGSLLTGVVSSGDGFYVIDDDVNLGLATAFNFGSNIKATVNNLISEVSLDDHVDILRTFAVATDKFTVNGVNGNTQVAGTLGVGSSLSVSGNINALNNKVINVGSAVSTTDATNKNYVDTRSIAMSIALS